MKKVIISISLIMAVILVFTACSSSAQYVDTPVTIPVTDENGKTVTDKNGEVVTEVVTKESGSQPSGQENTAQNNNLGGSEQNNTSKNSAQNNTEGSSAQTGGANGDATEGTDNSGNEATESTTENRTSNNQSTTKKQTTTKQTTTQKQTTTTTTKPTTTTKAKKRDVTITVNLPYYNGQETELTLYYRAEGDKKDTELEKRTVVLDDSKKKETFKIEKVKGEVYVYIELDGISVASYSNSITIPADENEGKITPVTGIEIMDGGML